MAMAHHVQVYETSFVKNGNTYFPQKVELDLFRVSSRPRAQITSPSTLAYSMPCALCQLPRICNAVYSVRAWRWPTVYKRAGPVLEKAEFNFSKIRFEHPHKAPCSQGWLTASSVRSISSHALYCGARHTCMAMAHRAVGGRRQSFQNYSRPSAHYTVLTRFAYSEPRAVCKHHILAERVFYMGAW